MSPWSTEQKREYMRNYNKRKQEEKGYTNHSFDIITEVCDRCGVQRKRTAILTRRGKFENEYRVNGKWTKDHPNCLPPKP